MEELPEPLATFIERWNAHDVDGVVALYAESAEMRDPALARPIAGHAALRRYYEDMWSDLPGATLSCRSAEADSSGIGWAWRFGPPGFEAVGASYFGLEDGLITRDDAVWQPARAR